MRPMVYYPVLLELEGRKCVVVGGGNVASRKVESLLECGASVHLVSPALNDELGRLVHDPRVCWTPREFVGDDLAGAFLAVAAADRDEVNAEVARQAEARGVLVNVVDDPGHCSFIVPSVVRRGDLIIAVSTSGASPALARRLRETLAEEFGPEYGPYLEFLREFRGLAFEQLNNGEDRRWFFFQLVEGDFLALIRQGRLEEARQVAGRLLGRTAREGRGTKSTAEH